MIYTNQATETAEMKEKREMWALKLTPTEKRQLIELADLDGINMSAEVRMLIKRSHSQRIKTGPNSGA